LAAPRKPARAAFVYAPVRNPARKLALPGVLFIVFDGGEYHIQYTEYPLLMPEPENVDIAIDRAGVPCPRHAARVIGAS